MDDMQKNTNTTPNSNALTSSIASATQVDSSVKSTTPAEIADPAIAGIKDAISKSDTMQEAFDTAAENISAANSDITTQMAEKIIKEQEGIIGPVAYEQATKVQGITIDQMSHHIKLEGDKKVVLENLVKQYEQLFGKISIAICKEAVRGVIENVPSDQIPQILL